MTIKITLEKEVYYAGETLIGKVELSQKESVKINNNVTIRLHGFGEVFGSLGVTGTRSEYLFKSSVLVVRSWKEAVYTGNFCLPFHFDLPSNLPSTFNHPNGKIVYYLDLVFDEVSEIKQKTEKQFVLLNKVDLNYRLDLRTPFTQHSSIKIPFEYTLSINRRAFLSGDIIQAKLSIKNNSDTEIEKVSICLLESVVLWTKKNSMEVNRVVARTDFSKSVEKRSSSIGQIKLRVPALWPSSNGHSNIIDVSYYLIVTTKPNEPSKPFDKPYEISSVSFDKESRLPILIGTVSFKEDLMEPPSYDDINETGEELPMYNEYHANSNRLSEVVVELDSRRLTLPAVVPELNNRRRSIGNLFGSVFGF